jgi:hypothetical protein
MERLKWHVAAIVFAIMAVLYLVVGAATRMEEMVILAGLFAVSSLFCSVMVRQQ